MANESAPIMAQPGSKEPPKAQRLHVYLKDLVLPPEVAREADDYCRRAGLRKAFYRTEVEKDVKRQYFFGGQTIGYIKAPEGDLVVLVGDLASDEFGEILEQLRHREGKQVQLVWSPKWNDDTSYIG